LVVLGCSRRAWIANARRLDYDHRLRGGRRGIVTAARSRAYGLCNAAGQCVVVDPTNSGDTVTWAVNP
jgi:hypothetical protein